MKNAFEINISTITGKPGHRIEVKTEAELAGLKTSGSHVAPGVAILFDGCVETVDGGIVTEGEVVSSWVGECRRCLGVAQGEIHIHARELYERNSNSTDDENVIGASDTYSYQGDYLDLMPMVRDAVMLELPVAPLCRPDCAGLCSVCGANRNEVNCGHTNEVKDDRWAALEQLKDLQ